MTIRLGGGVKRVFLGAQKRNVPPTARKMRRRAEALARKQPNKEKRP